MVVFLLSFKRNTLLTQVTTISSTNILSGVSYGLFVLPCRVVSRQDSDFLNFVEDFII